MKNFMLWIWFVLRDEYRVTCAAFRWLWEYIPHPPFPLIDVFFDPCDLWIGAYWNSDQRTLFVCVFPMCGILFHFKRLPQHRPSEKYPCVDRFSEKQTPYLFQKVKVMLNGREIQEVICGCISEGWIDTYETYVTGYDYRMPEDFSRRYRLYGKIQVLWKTPQKIGTADELIAMWTQSLRERNDATDKTPIDISHQFSSINDTHSLLADDRLHRHNADHLEKTLKGENQPRTIEQIEYMIKRVREKRTGWEGHLILLKNFLLATIEISGPNYACKLAESLIDDRKKKIANMN